MKNVFLITLFLIFYSGCSVKLNYVNVHNQENRDLLVKTIKNISPNVDPKEAKDLSMGLLKLSKTLTKKYSLMQPPYFHNFLVNISLKKRGLCYHWMHDFRAFVDSKKYKTLLFYDAISDADLITEHSALVVGAKGVEFKNSIVLDAWRKSGVLVAKKVKDDKSYNWVKIKYKSSH